jgi:Glycosyltransferase family 87
VKASKLKFFAVLYLLGMVAMQGEILWRLRDSIFKGYSDFASFYTAGKLVQQGRSSGLYDPHLQWEAQQQFALEVKIRKGPLPYIRPPFEALLFLPLSYLPYRRAYLLWTAVKLLLLLAIPFIARPVSGEALLPAHMEGVLCLGLFPIGLDLLHGQDSILLLLVFVLTFQFWRRGAEFWSGCMLGLGLFKFHLVIPVAAVFLLRRKGRFSAGFLLVGVALFAASVALVGWGGIPQYPKYIWSLDHRPGMGVTTWVAMPNLRAVLTALSPGHVVGTPAEWLWGAVACFGVAATAWLWGNAPDKNETRSAAGFSLAIAVTLLTSYYAYGYDLSLLLVPILLLGGAVLHRAEFRGRPRGLFIAAVGSFLLSPLYWLLILFTHQFYWVALLVLLMLAAALAGAMERRVEPQMASASQ